MSGWLVDSNVILDIFLDDPHWSQWSINTLYGYQSSGDLYINSIIYTEVSIGFKRIEELDLALGKANFKFLEIPKEALFLAGKTFLNYRRRKGVKLSPLPDFFIGAHAAVLSIELITRDTSRYRTYFPTVGLITP